MDTNTGLAAVHAAADSISRADHEAAVVAAGKSALTAISTIAALTAAFPELAAQLRTEGATAERTRILGIEANAIPGHEALVASLKADASVSPDMAAGRILGAERKLREGAALAIADVETGNKGIRPAPTGQPNAGGKKVPTTPDELRAEFAGSAELQAEFAGDVESYVGFKTAEAAGKVHRLAAKTA